MGIRHDKTRSDWDAGREQTKHHQPGIFVGEYKDQWPGAVKNILQRMLPHESHRQVSLLQIERETCWDRVVNVQLGCPIVHRSPRSASGTKSRLGSLNLSVNVCQRCWMDHYISHEEVQRVRDPTPNRSSAGWSGYTKPERMSSASSTWKSVAGNLSTITLGLQGLSYWVPSVK